MMWRNALYYERHMNDQPSAAWRPMLVFDAGAAYLVVGVWVTE